MSKIVCQVKTGKTFQVINVYPDEGKKSATTCRTTVLPTNIIKQAYATGIYDVTLAGDKETIEPIQQSIIDLEKSEHEENKITVTLTY